MTHPETRKMLQLVEDQTGYCVSVDLISGIQEHARMISARPENPVHLIRVNDTQRAGCTMSISTQLTTR